MPSTVAGAGVWPNAVGAAESWPVRDLALGAGVGDKETPKKLRDSAVGVEVGDKEPPKNSRDPAVGDAVGPKVKLSMGEAVGASV